MVRRRECVHKATLIAALLFESMGNMQEQS
jgi:hypothetical protein